ncbi:H(+)/Cl(-) exchange transporter ClcA [Acetonema longum]|uniref:Cl-channel, voltage-gated family protein n=1 Tax=Acetonema longum DSM 6540 TaxID=1009370 RepID=F7NQG0_9FIRM|nr:H(+)/Cl(-) exchange transporter ClcA [Acetonema longum]EGO61738.1 Cl- channel, voltage-gated family protein [Acetonema longum DSM 6540]
MAQQGISKVYYALSHWRNFRLKIFAGGILIGLVAGAVVVVFRYFIAYAEWLRTEAYAHLRHNPALIPAWFLFLLLVAFILGLIVKYEPMAGGSGIPQVKGVMLRRMKMVWQKVLPAKLAGGVLAIGAGLSLGREGPSIQLGAVVGQGLSRLMGQTKMEERYLLTSGASAGLAAAFNAPLAGVMFALEELHKNFSPAVLMAAMAASVTADWVSQLAFGQKAVFNFERLTALPPGYYGHVITLGVIAGLGGILFNQCLLRSLDLYDRQRVLPKIMQAAFPLLVGGLAGLILPEILGGGHELIGGISAGHYDLPLLFVLLAAKFSFTILSYGCGVPGGIFLPLLVIGALLGGSFATVSIQWTTIQVEYVNNFVILGMAALFAAITKAPVTGSILIMEMTGSFSHLFPLITISMTAHLVADIANSPPVYEALLNRSLAKQKPQTLAGSSERQTVAELVVCLDSKLDGKYIKDVAWPDSSLLVSIKRGEAEIVPKGDTKILAGDYLYILTDETNTKLIDDLAEARLS